jgi:hypothetical protein
MMRPIVVDGRRVLDRAALERAGYQYLCLGRQPDSIPASAASPSAP